MRHSALQPTSVARAWPVLRRSWATSSGVMAMALVVSFASGTTGAVNHVSMTTWVFAAIVFGSVAALFALAVGTTVWATCRDLPLRWLAVVLGVMWGAGFGVVYVAPGLGGDVPLRDWFIVLGSGSAWGALTGFAAETALPSVVENVIDLTDGGFEVPVAVDASETGIAADLR